MADIKHVLKPHYNHTGTAIFFHGAGSRGSLMRFSIKTCRDHFRFNQVAIKFPTAPKRNFTRFDGEPFNIWFDFDKFAYNNKEFVDSIDQGVEEAKAMVQKEIDSGIPAERILLGGFSQGAMLALHVGYRALLNLAGIFVFSGFLPKSSVVFKELDKKNYTKLPALYWSHGTIDPVVHYSWGKKTFKKLTKKYGVDGTFVELQTQLHNFNHEGVYKFYKWVEKVVPDLDLSSH